MPPRGSSREHSHDRQSIQLSQLSGADEEDQDIHPDSDSAFLRRHRSSHESVGESVIDENVPAPGILSRIVAFMSRSPIRGGSSSAENPIAYGAISGTEDDDDNTHRRDKGKGRTTAVRSDMSSDRPDTRRRQRSYDVAELRSRDRGQTQRRTSSPLLSAESGHLAGYGGHLGGNLPFEVPVEETDDTGEEDARSIDRDDDKNDPIDNSQYPQVRASVAATDNISACINTPRMWTLSLLCAILGSATNLLFSLRYPSVAITPVIALVVVHPLGLVWDACLKREEDPPVVFEYGIRVDQAKDRRVSQSWTKGLRLWLAQGTWNEKEHACVYVSSNVAFGFAFATDVIVEQHKFYKQDVSIVYQVLLTISTQILGYSFAGLTRRYLVSPPSMIWPGTLMASAMFTTVHSSENKVANGWRITRWTFFLTVFSAAFTWYFLPGLLMPALSYFSVVTWFAPNNVVIANLFGVKSGLGLFPMTFDWAQIAYIGSPLLTPWWAAANVVGGLVIVMWVLAPLLYYNNALFCAYLPILSSSVFDNSGKPYQVSRILTSDYHFAENAYLNYSKVYLPITYVLSYGVQFASLAALVTHTACWHGKDIWEQTKRSFTLFGRETVYQPLASSPEIPKSSSSPASLHASNIDPEPGIEASMAGEDVHNRLMRRYDDAPISWYLATFVSMLAIGIFIVEYYPVYLPWYGLLLALSITTVLFIPVGIVMAITNQHSSLYLICQLICGVVFPGRPVANMVFVTYCYISSAQGIKFSSDLKLGHYMKIPPKTLFSVQLTATLVSSLTQVAVLNWMFVYIPSLCTDDAINGFTCPIARVHFNGSILWGVIGPLRFFGPSALYHPLIYFFPLGLLSPIIIYLFARRSPATSLLRKINLPVLFGSLAWIPPATGLNFSTWALVCFFFNGYLRRRKPEWWGKYTMTLSAGLDSGLAVGVVVVFFGVLYPGWGWVEGGFLQWWGTRVFKEGCDWRGCALLGLEEGEKFDGG